MKWHRACISFHSVAIIFSYIPQFPQFVFVIMYMFCGRSLVSVQVGTARLLLGWACKNMKAALRMRLKGSGAQSVLREISNQSAL